MSTLAQRVADAFNSSKVTISINALALPLGGQRKKIDNVLYWSFPDRSMLASSGRGRSHKIKVAEGC